MKTLFRLLSVFAVIAIFLVISCKKESSEPQPEQKSSFTSNPSKKAFSAKNNTMLYQVAAIAKKLNFTAAQQSPDFAQQAPSLPFTGGTGTYSPIMPDVPSGCIVSSIGYPDQDFGFIFQYLDNGRINYISLFEYGYEIRTFFTYDSKGRIIKTENCELYNGYFVPYSYDVFTYNSQGQVTQVYENIIDYADAYFDVTYDGQTVKYTTDFYDTEMIYQYSNGNVVKETINITAYGDVYTETTTYQFDNKSNFWKPLNIPQPFFTFYAWMESKNNWTKMTYTDFEGYVSSSSYWYDYNSEGYPSWMYSDDLGWGPIEYINCGK